MRGQYAVARRPGTDFVDDVASEQPRLNEIGNSEAVAEAVPATSDPAAETKTGNGARPADSVAPASGRREEIPRYGWFG